MLVGREKIRIFDGMEDYENHLETAHARDCRLAPWLSSKICALKAAIAKNGKSVRVFPRVVPTCVSLPFATLSDHTNGGSGSNWEFAVSIATIMKHSKLLYRSGFSERPSEDAQKMSVANFEAHSLT